VDLGRASEHGEERGLPDSVPPNQRDVVPSQAQVQPVEQGAAAGGRDACFRDLDERVHCFSTSRAFRTREMDETVPWMVRVSPSLSATLCTTLHWPWMSEMTSLDA
jgi:hypothetical protein